MTPRLAILCSGQGAQHPGMFDLARTDPVAASLLDTWVPPSGMAGILDLFANRVAQSIVTASACATWAALRVHVPAPAAVAGYSVGEVAALSVAGVIDPADAVALAHLRAAVMDSCVDPDQLQGLLAVSGLSLPTVRRLLDQMNAFETEVAIINGHDQCILGGPVDDGPPGAGLVTLARGFERAGAQTVRLPVTIASHTGWMRAAVAPLEAHIKRLPAKAPTTRLLAGVSGEASATAATALAALIRQTDQTVRWDACMDAMAESGITVALELGPGSGLSRMLAFRHPGIACRSAAEFRTLDGIGRWIARQ